MQVIREKPRKAIQNSFQNEFDRQQKPRDIATVDKCLFYFDYDREDQDDSDRGASETLFPMLTLDLGKKYDIEAI